MTSVLPAVDILADLTLDADVLARCATLPAPARTDFYTPSFKAFSSCEIGACGAGDWPAVSLTGGECALNCDHCRARLLQSMVPAASADALWRVAETAVAGGARGMLVSGGSDRQNEIGFAPFLPVMRRIKQRWPDFRLAVHAALVDDATARGLADAGVDVAMLDLIGARDSLRQVYHLRREVDDFERSLASLIAAGLRVVPHIVVGLHYGQLLGEWRALDMLRRQRPAALVLVAAMPHYADAARPFATVDAHEVGHFFADARAALPDLPLLLGCARPPGAARQLIDSYAVLAGFDGVAHPAEGVVELARRLGREVGVVAGCCSLAGSAAQLALRQDRRLAQGLGSPAEAA